MKDVRVFDSSFVYMVGEYTQKVVDNMDEDELKQSLKDVLEKMMVRLPQEKAIEEIRKSPFSHLVNEYGFGENK